MKSIYIITLISLLGWFSVIAQEFDIVLSSSETGTKTHQARNSITMGPEYTYTPNGGTLTAQIVNPVVNGNINYNYTVIDPETRSLNTSYVAGTSNGSFSVNAMGGATYSIPLDLPPGIGGLQPNIALTYNSMAGQGIAGMGWNISGLSAITRAGKNFYNDGTATGVELNANDQFLLDGQRLKLTSGSHGAYGSQYRTELDIFTRVTCYSGANGPTNFYAEAKNGLKYQYGYDQDARQIIDGQTQVISWMVDKVTDVYGNFISFEYFRDNGMVYIGEIAYGPNTITFFYKTRSDKTFSFIKGSKVQQELLLDKIEIKYNSTVIKKYEFLYNCPWSDYTRYSLLNEIVEYGIGSNRLNSTVFAYQIPDDVTFELTVNNTSNDFVTYKSFMVTGDFNGDGLADFFCLPKPDHAGWTGIRVRFGDGNDNFNTGFSSTISINYSNLQDIRALDLNGDGIDDILYEEKAGTTNYFKYLICTGSGFNGPYTMVDNGYLNDQTGLSGKKSRKLDKQEDDNQMSGSDYNGDGIQDIFINNSLGNWWIFSMGNLSGSLSGMGLRASGTLSTMNGPVLSADFNGDGKTDIWSFTPTGVRIYTLNGTTLEQIYSSTWPTSNHHFSLGDFNGDGKTDMFIYGYDNADWSTWQLHLSTGIGFVGNDIPQKKQNLKNDYVRLGDFNGDGVVDIMVTSANNSWNGTILYITKNNASDFFVRTIETFPLAVTYDWHVADFNGDGRTDFLCVDGESPWWNGYRMYRSGSKNKHPLVKIANGFNHLTKINYKTMSQYGTPYTKGSGALFPAFDFQGALPVVSSVNYDNGTGSLNTVNYAYEGAKIHLQGKGFLCMSKQTVTDVQSNMVTESHTSYHPILYYPQQTYLANKHATVTLSSTSNMWLHHTTATGVIMPYISSQSQLNSLTGHSVAQTFTYNSTNGNLTQTVISYDNGVTETTANSYDTNTTYSWIGGRLTESTVTYAKTGESSIARTTKYTYATDGKLKPDLVKYLEGTNWYVYKNYDYNTQGNVTQEYAYSNNGGARQANYTYENDYIRVKTVTNPLGHITTFTYDTYGRKATEKDYLNNTTSYAYDNFGRVTTVTQPDGFVSTTSYNWGLSGGPANACYNIQESGNDGSLTKTWYDRLSRQLRSDVKGFSGSTNIYTATEYNSKGQVYRVSEPSFNPAPTLWNVFTYDNYGRQQNITRPSGRNTTYTFDDWVSSKVTETTGGITSWKETNSQGLLTSANDGGGTITYAYYPDGNLKSINAPGNVPTSMEYDIAGNQVKLIDPSAGTIEYTWNAYGQMLTQKNAENKVTEYTYLPDGRVNTKITPEGTETYGYNTNKQLTGITNPGTAVNRGYSYDSKGRVQQITETIAGTNFSTNFTYDNLGRLSTRTHPSGIVETNNYNGNGYLASISAGGATRFTVTAMNERQQITAATYGSTLTGDFGYNSYGYPTHSKARVGTTFRQAYKYEFDPVTGNLNWRQDSLRNLTENFTYDNLDRLLTVTGPQNLTMQYAANGNITGKSDLGTANQFIYGNSARPYRLTGLETNTNLVPVTLQQITYTSFEQPNTITESPYQATFKYNTEGQRASMVVTQNGSAILSRSYVGSRYIKDSNGNEYTWIGGDAYTAPCVVAKTGGTTNWYYVLRDHLGTITHLVFASTNTVAGEYSFDAWGRRRDRDDWSYTLAGDPDLLVNRGFTAHEWLPWFNLYNMNGRLYDPVVGRFLSPDNYVQMPDFSQNFNRYSYCLNNPLKYNDPDGEKFKDWLEKVVVKIVIILVDGVYIAYVAITTAAGILGGMALGAMITQNPVGSILGGIVGASTGFIVGSTSGRLVTSKVKDWVYSW